MSSRKLVLLLFALLIAGGAIILARQALAPPEAEQVAEAKPTGPEVLVAARDLSAGSLLKDADMKWQVWPSAPKETMLVKDLADKTEYIGALSRSALRAGEPIIINRVFKANEQGFLSAALMPGMRAISVKLTPVSGIAGLIFPGDRVDVLIAHNVQVPVGNGQMRERRVSETVIINARVLALDQKTDEKSTDPKIADVATLEVTPKDAEKIALIADWGGNLSLVLRSLSEGLEAEASATPSLPPVQPQASLPDGIDLALPDIAPIDKPRSSYTWDSDVSPAIPQPEVAAAPPHKVKVMRGKETTEVNFDQ